MKTVMRNTDIEIIKSTTFTVLIVNLWRGRLCPIFHVVKSKIAVPSNCAN